MAMSETPDLVVGTVETAPRRRGASKHTFFVELIGADGSEHHVLFKAARRGGLLRDELVSTLRRDIRSGDTIEVRVGRRDTYTPNIGSDGPVPLLHAADAVITHMQVGGSTGVSRLVAATPTAPASPAPTLAADEEQSHLPEDEQLDLPGDGIGREHGLSSPTHCRERFVVLSQWIASTFAPQLAGGGVIVEVAGGKGELSLMLTLMGFRCELVDPREHSGLLSRKQRKALRRSSACVGPINPWGVRAQEPFAVHRCFFGGEDEASAATTAQLLERAALVVGLHPDEATEAIVQTAARARLPFAVVPCCVFGRLFCARRVRGRPVSTHADLCDYLQAAVPGAQRASLPFAGKNTVIYHAGPCAVCAECAEELLVRPLEPDDLPACAQIEAAAYPPEVTEGVAVLCRHRAHHPSGCFAALVCGQIAGYALSAPVRFRDCPLTLSAAELPPCAAADGAQDAGTLYLHDVAVAPARHGQGVGRALLERVAGHAGVRPITLTAVCGAAAYWQRRGFAAIPPSQLSEAARARLREYPADAELMQRASAVSMPAATSSSER